MHHEQREYMHIPKKVNHSLIGISLHRFLKLNALLDSHSSPKFVNSFHTLFAESYKISSNHSNTCS